MLENNHLVSVIMPAYNAENYLEASVQSVLNQTYINWELIIIDDGSKDCTSQIAQKYKNIDKRIHYIYQINSKQAVARNNGIKHAKGEILAFLDSDDLWLPQKLEISLKYFDLNKQDLIFTDAYYCSDQVINVLDKNYNKMDILDEEYSYENGIVAFIKGNRIPMLTVLVKKDVIEEAGLFDEKFTLAEDYDMWLRLLKNNCVFKAISLPLSIYRIHQNSSSSSDRLAIDSVLKSIMKNFNADELKKMNLDPFIKIWIKRWMSDYLTTNNIYLLKRILVHFDYIGVTYTVVFGLQNYIGFKNFKRLILKRIG